MKEYLYCGLIAQHWDLLAGDTANWLSGPYFLDLIRKSGEPTLDVACGTGRLLLDYMGRGIDIDGVDISPDMIGICEANARKVNLSPKLYVQSMQELKIPRKYKTIIVPSSSFLHLTDKMNAFSALMRFRNHLQPGGTLAMAMTVIEPSPDDGHWKIVAEATRPSDQALIRKSFRCTNDVENRLQYGEDHYEIFQLGKLVQTETHIGSPYLTWYRASEARQLLETAGFVDVITNSNFRFESTTDEDTNYVVHGTNPSGQ